MQILLVEDDDVAAESLIRHMRKFKIDLPIIIAEDGQIALDILRGTHPHETIDAPYLILLDINMPRMSGFEFLEILRADENLKDSVVFMLTTSNSEKDKAKAQYYGVVGYVVKDLTSSHFANLSASIKECATARR